MSEQPEAQLIPNLSKFHCLIHELYHTNHHSSLEHAIYGTSCLLLAVLNPTARHHSTLTSISLILSPLLLAFHFLLSSFFRALYRPPWPFLDIVSFIRRIHVRSEHLQDLGPRPQLPSFACPPSHFPIRRLQPFHNLLKEIETLITPVNLLSNLQRCHISCSIECQIDRFSIFRDFSSKKKEAA